MSDLSHRTAISRTKPSSPSKFLDAHIPKGSSILDYGCGKGMDSQWFREKGHSVFQYDPYWFPDFPKIESVDYTICNYVLNVIEEPKARTAVLEKVRSFSRISGFIAVRSDISSIGKNWISEGDGFRTNSGTFQKIYTRKSLMAEFGEINIIKTTGEFILFKV